MSRLLVTLNGPKKPQGTAYFFVGVASIPRHSSGIHTTHEEIRGNRNTEVHKKACPGYQNSSVTGRKSVYGMAGYPPIFLHSWNPEQAFCASL